MLVTCHECSKQMSTEATACPHCGAPPKATPRPAAAVARPARKRASPIVVFGGGFLAFVVAFGIWGTATGRHEAPDRAQADADCRTSLQCWGDRNLGKAHVYCKDYLERLALHRVRWTDEGLLDRKFSRFHWLNQGAGTITYIGDKAEFQNGYGAYTPVTYACNVGDLDASRPTVLGVRVLREGRLPPG